MTNSGKSTRLRKSYRFSPETVKTIEGLIPVVRRLTDQNSDATAVLEFAVKELAKNHLKPKINDKVEATF